MTHFGQMESLDAPRGPSDDIRPGDRICTGANVHPNHEVIAIYRDKAWIRDLRSGYDGVTSLSRCHKP